MRGSILFALAVVSCVLLASCGGSMNSHMSPSNGVPMSLTIGNTPPNGVGVLFIEAMITGVSLQPSDAMKPAVTTIKVVTLSGMDFMDFSGPASMGSLAVGNTVSVKGLLFNTRGVPTLVTRTVRENDEH